jgi:hypothetical protein
MAEHVDESLFDEKDVYLGVCLGERRNATYDKSEGLGSHALNEALAPLKDITKFIENFAKYDDMVVSDAEVAFWSKKAEDVHRTLSKSSIRAVPANSAEVAWLIAQPLWPEMTQPSPSASAKEVWGPGEVLTLVEGIVKNERRWVEVEQIDAFGKPQKGYTITLAISRFPDVLSFPDQEPWMHFAAQQPFSVDFSTRMSIVPSTKVQKDVSKKLAIAKDQAQHIYESGTSVPLKIQEQMAVASELEFTIDKDRMPWAYSWHRITVTGETPDIATARARTIIEAYRELGIDVAWPSGDQLDLLCESMPGDTVRSKSYYQRQELALIGGGMPTASSEAGDRISGGAGWIGPYIGRTTARVVTPVFFSPHVAMTRNQPPGIAITGSPGGGKSFLAFTLAYQMAVQGVWTIYIDPKADAKPMGMLPGLGNPRVFDLREGNDGMLDPFSMGDQEGKTEEERLGATVMLVLETLRLLLGGDMPADREKEMFAAVEAVASQPNPSLNKVVDYLLNHPSSAEANNLGSYLKLLRTLPFARLCFSNTGGTRLRPEDGLTVVTLLGLDLPTAGVRPEDLSYDNRLAVAIMYLLTRYARQLMLGMDKGHPKAICIDEAWAITGTPQGAKLIPEIARMGRSHNTALVLVSQNAGDLMEKEVTNNLSTKFAFRSAIPAEIDDVLELFGLEGDQNYQGAVRDLQNGECLMQDVDGRVTRVQIDAWDSKLFDTFNTNPETRGKDSSASSQKGSR